MGSPTIEIFKELANFIWQFLSHDINIDGVFNFKLWHLIAYPSLSYFVLRKIMGIERSVDQGVHSAINKSQRIKLKQSPRNQRVSNGVTYNDGNLRPKKGGK